MGASCSSNKQMAGRDYIEMGPSVLFVEMVANRCTAMLNSQRVRPDLGNEDRLT